MSSSLFVDPEKVKRESEEVILHAGGDINESLPLIEDNLKLRHGHEIADRALVVNALFQVHLGVPTDTIGRWLNTNNVSELLTAKENSILEKATGALTDQEMTDFYWYKEALWALLWVGSIVEAIPFDSPAGGHVVPELPNLAGNEPGSRLIESMHIRHFHEVFSALDLYYRLHWYARDGRLNDYSTGNVDMDIIMERRRALEWVMHPEVDWDKVDLST
jgi:hypothetical protein